MNTLRETALVERHRRLGGKMVEFAGWLMPVQYGKGIIHEHLAVRRSVGLFDVSHMGEISVKGRGAADYVDRLGTNTAPRTQGKVVYTPMCYPNGGIVDDILVYCMDENDYVLVVNAANVSKDFEWVSENAPRGVTVVDESAATAQLAIQGPSAVELTCSVMGNALAELTRFTSTKIDYRGDCAVVSRTGYTGEDGFEVYVKPELGGELWDELMRGAGTVFPEPVGLGARDTLRFEASYRLYGNDIDETTDPFEAGLGWTVKMDKDDFIGMDALERRRREGLSRRFVGFELNARRIARKGCRILAGGVDAGEVTSGAFAPHLGTSLAMGYLRADLAAPGTPVEVDIKGRIVEASVVKIPFLKAKAG